MKKKATKRAKKLITDPKEQVRLAQIAGERSACCEFTGRGVVIRRTIKGGGASGTYETVAGVMRFAPSWIAEPEPRSDRYWRVSL